MEERLVQIEDDHKSIRSSMQQLTLSFEKLSGMMSLINSKFENHLEEERNYEKTIRNIDDNVTALRLDLARLPAARNADIKKQLDPVWVNIRKTDKHIEELALKHEQDNSSFQEKSNNKLTEKIDKLERKIQTQAGGIVVICWALIFVIYSNMKEDIKENKQHDHKPTAMFNHIKSKYKGVLDE